MRFLRQRPMWVLFFIVLLDLLGFGIIIPILPLLFANAHASTSLIQASGGEQTGYIYYGLLVAIYPFCQFLATPILGQLSDIYGRRRILVLSLMGTMVSYILFGIGVMTRNIPLLVFARALDGITGANLSVAQAVVADMTDANQRARQFGLLGAGFGIGLILGPYLGGKLSDPAVMSWFTFETPFWFAAILSAINVLAVIFILPETRRMRPEHKHIELLKSVRDVIKIGEYKEYYPLLLSGFLYQCGFALFASFFGIFLYKHFKFTQGTIGDYFAYAGLWIAITQVVAARVLGPLKRQRIVVMTNMVFCTLAIGAFFLPMSIWQLYAITAFFAVNNGLMQTGILSLLSAASEHHGQGKVLGINSSIYALAQIFPPLISGFIAASIHSEAPIVAAGLLVAAAAMTFVPVFTLKVLRDRI